MGRKWLAPLLVLPEPLYKRNAAIDHTIIFNATVAK